VSDHPSPFDLPGVDDLFGADLNEFVTTRDRLAKTLREDGQREAAAAVKKLRRPTRTAWAVNQVARRRQEDVATLVEAGQALEEAQATAVGKGDPGLLREASRRRRALLADLSRAATELAGAAHHDEATATFDAASLDPELVPELLAGRLTKELPPPSGFGLGAMPEPTVDEEPDRPEGQAATEDLERARHEVAQAEAAVHEATARVEQARERLAAAEAAARAAEAELVEATTARDRAREALADLE
jgi:hypothetical protein